MSEHYTHVGGEPVALHEVGSIADKLLAPPWLPEPACGPLRVAERLMDQLGPCVLLGIPPGQKGPRTAGWQKRRQADMTPAYLASLNHGGNIGVLLGQASNGLCTVDADGNEQLEAFLSCNPGLRASLISRGQRGGNVWLRIRGDYPARTANLTTRDGAPWGEWRAVGSQTVIFGTHPSGCTYQHNGNPPLEIEFSEINWPEGVTLPWRREEGPIPKPQATASGESYTTNDAGRAQRFVDRYAGKIRYVPERKLWLIWQGDRWTPDRTGGMERLAIELSREMLADVAKIAGTDASANEARKAASREALACGDRQNIGDMLSLAAIDLRVILEESQLDSDPWLVGATNAVVDLRTGEIRDYTRADYITRTLGVDADPQATCPRFQRFINEIFPDSDVARFVWKAAGYSLTGLTKEQCFFFLYGTGSNGKSTLLETMEAIFGGCAERAGKGLIAANQRGDYPLREAAAINGARLLLASETDESDRFNESVIKDLTGGETMRGAHLYQNAFTFRPVCKLWIAGNHKPSVRGADNGIWRRVRLIPFERTFSPEERDPELVATLQAEASGILNWLIVGCLRWQEEELTPSAAIAAAVSDYRSEEDTLADFIESTIGRGPACSTPHSDVFKAYRAWAEDAGLRYPLSRKALAKHLRERGWRDDRTGKISVLWRGVRLKKEERYEPKRRFPPNFLFIFLREQLSWKNPLLLISLIKMEAK